jgi:D-sedoheptulose 7-phosphate isomerase
VIDAHLSALAAVALAARDAMTPSLEAASAAMAVAVRDGQKVLAFGNGGSATQAQHFAAELVVRYKDDRPALPSIALTCDGAILTACANDFAYDYVFARQVEALGRPGDVALGLSTSGTSPNVVKALEAARARGLVTILVTGSRGVTEAAKWDHGIVVPSAETAHIQEVTLAVLHLLCQAVENGVRS